MAEHDGHRERSKAEGRKRENFDDYPDYRVLELILFNVIPRRDVTPTARALTARFGSLAGVLEAPIEDLLEVEGVGQKTAEYLKFLPKVFRKYVLSALGLHPLIRNPHDVGRFVLPKFVGVDTEVVYILLLDNRGRVTDCRRVGKGGLDSVVLNINETAEYAVSHKASGVIMAHNHTSGVALPSIPDMKATVLVMDALSSCGVRLVDHIVVADNDYVSFSDNGFFKKSNLERIRALREAVAGEEREMAAQLMEIVKKHGTRGEPESPEDRENTEDAENGDYGYWYDFSVHSGESGKGETK